MLSVTHALLCSFTSQIMNHAESCLPSFYIIGAPKAGSTMLANLLNRAPQLAVFRRRYTAGAISNGTRLRLLRRP